MNADELIKTIDETLGLLVEVADEYVEEIVSQFDIGSPEKLIGKKYEQWGPQDFANLGQIYGPEPNSLSRLIFRKEYAKVLQMEKE